MRLRAAALAATATLAPSAGAMSGRPTERRCSKLFTVRMGERAGRAVYSGTGRVTAKQLRLLGYLERCQRNPHAQAFVRWYDRSHARLWKAARAAAQTATSWVIPTYIVMCESHGQNLPPNSAGASGYYQIIPSTWAAYGGSGPAAYLASKAGQDAVASRIWNGGRGASQWVCAG